MRAGAKVVLFLSSCIAGCELGEVSAPVAEETLVVEAILRAGADRQYVLLHRSLNGRVVRGEEGASVVVTRADGHPVTFAPVPMAFCLSGDPDEWTIGDIEVEVSCYVSPPSAADFVQPGSTYDLTVSTPDGRLVRGRTTVPGTFEFRNPRVSVDAASLSAVCRISEEAFELVWTSSAGAWAYITSLRLSEWGDELRQEGIDVPDPLDLTGVSVSAADTSLAFPMNLGLFQRFDLDQRLLIELQDGIPADAKAVLVVLAADRNYTNAVRGGRFNPSGTVRISSVVGDGVGVFGSVAALRIESPVTGATACPTEAT